MKNDHAHSQSSHLPELHTTYHHSEHTASYSNDCKTRQLSGYSSTRVLTFETK